MNDDIDDDIIYSSNLKSRSTVARNSRGQVLPRGVGKKFDAVFGKNQIKLIGSEFVKDLSNLTKRVFTNGVSPGTFTINRKSLQVETGKEGIKRKKRSQQTLDRALSSLNDMDEELDKLNKKTLSRADQLKINTLKDKKRRNFESQLKQMFKQSEETISDGFVSLKGALEDLAPEGSGSGIFGKLLGGLLAPFKGLQYFLEHPLSATLWTTRKLFSGINGLMKFTGESLLLLGKSAVKLPGLLFGLSKATGKAIFSFGKLALTNPKALFAGITDIFKGGKMFSGIAEKGFSAILKDGFMGVLRFLPRILGFVLSKLNIIGWVVTAAWLIWKYILPEKWKNKITAGLKSVWHRVEKFFSPIMKALKPVFHIVKRVGEIIAGVILLQLKVVWWGIKKIASGLEWLGKVVWAVDKYLLKGLWNYISNYVISPVVTAFKYVKKHFAAIVGVLSAIIAPITNFFKPLVTKVESWFGPGSVIGSIFDSIDKVFSSMKTWLRDKIEKFAGKTVANLIFGKPDTTATTTTATKAKAVALKSSNNKVGLRSTKTKVGLRPTKAKAVALKSSNNKVVLRPTKEDTTAIKMPHIIMREQKAPEQKIVVAPVRGGQSHHNTMPTLANVPLVIEDTGLLLINTDLLT